MGDRIQRWLQSDLIGVFATITVVVLIALALVVFFVLGPIAGILFGVAIVALTFYLLSRTSRPDATDIGDIAAPPAETAQQVLVVANQGLSSPALERELARRAEAGPLEVRLIVPAPAMSPGRRLANDVDQEAAEARRRLDDALGRLGGRGISASGGVDEEAPPMRALLDGLREFPADEVLIVPGAEPDWDEAESLSERIRAETDVQITELSA